MQDNFKIGSIASGMGMHLHGLKQIGGVPVWAIECDEAIAQCYRNNHQGRLYVQKVQDVDPHELADIDLLTVTLSCKNASTAKGKNRGETIEDTSAGEAVANIIRAKLPKYFMLENVWAYRDFESFKLIQDALAECGYYFQFYKFNLKDWGIAQSRDRLYGLAVRGGAFSAPEIPQISIKGWYEAIEDLIPQLPETELAPWQQKKFPDLLGNALIKRVGGGRAGDRLYNSSEPAFTIKALGRGSSNHWHQADVCVDGKFYAVTPQACLRFFGDKETADSIWLPPTKSLAMEVVGNGASWVMLRELFEHLTSANTDIKPKSTTKPLVNNQPKIMFNFPQTQNIC
jgi:site-specific DNA-cytosine methylase